jgi:hypothetical protein
MDREEIVKALRRESTVRLFFLGFITLGIYVAYYIKRQTACMNHYLDEERHISEALVGTILILAYITAILIVPYLLVEEGHPIQALSNFLDAIWGILVLIWAFAARNRMNILLSAKKGDETWFNGLWTFLFTVFYFNYKIIKLNATFAKKRLATAC